MAPSESTPTSVTDAKFKNEEKEENKENDTKVPVSWVWGVGMSAANLIYGHLMIANNLPPDSRQDSWYLMVSPIPTFLLSVCYVFGVTWLGPYLMRNRKPFTGLRSLMVAYNAFQVAFSAYLVFESGMGGWFGHYSFRCQACDFSDDPRAIRMLNASYWYYFSKFVDFLDTVFFVLHKKYEHISLLHVCHHALMPVSMWYGVRYQPGGHNTLMGLLNSFVHVVMYGYYLLAAMGPRVRPYLWWKKHVTSLQMVQFITIFLHSLQLVFIECPGVSPIMTSWVAGNSIMFLVLFSDFYIKAYNNKRRLRTLTKENVKISGIKLPSITMSPSVGGGLSRKTSPHSVGDTASKTMEMCENMALRSRLGAI